VRLAWCVRERKDNPAVRKGDFIENYSGLDEMHRIYAEWCIDEMFSEPEANAFAEWLRKSHDLRCDIEGVDLPIPGNRGPIGMMPSGGRPCTNLRDMTSHSRWRGFTIFANPRWNNCNEP
jgi:hypothetical protein